MGSMEPRSVAVIGAGFMGGGIAEAVARAGVPVVLRDVDRRAVDGALARVEQSLSRAVAGGKLDRMEAEATAARIGPTTELPEIAEADLVIEAVPERLELKLAVLSEIATVVRADAVIASNTSSIPITQLARAVIAPGRFVGLHFFSPVPVMRLVEVVSGLDTDADTVTAVSRFAERIGKRPITTGDRAGFVVNMLLVPYLMAAVRMYEEGFAAAEDIDAGMELGCGHPMGPLRLTDFIGLDVIDAVGDSLYDEFKRADYASPPLLKRMVAAGRLGRKSGRGFYDYS
jgi:3-hydroxybutyryl-CoA dehydrogenase